MANDSNNRPRQRGGALLIRVLVLAYVLYMAFGVAAAYVRGDPDALSLPLTVVVVAVLAGVTLVLLYLTYRQWREEKDGGAEPPEEEP